MTAEENKKIAKEALIDKIESEIDKAAKDGNFCQAYKRSFPKSVIYHFTASILLLQKTQPFLIGLTMKMAFILDQTYLPTMKM